MVRPSRGSPALEYLSVPPPWLIGVLLNSVRPTGPGGPGGGGGVPVGVLLHAATRSSRTGRTARRMGPLVRVALFLEGEVLPAGGSSLASAGPRGSARLVEHTHG